MRDAIRSKYFTETIGDEYCRTNMSRSVLCSQQAVHMSIFIGQDLKIQVKILFQIRSMPFRSSKNDQYARLIPGQFGLMLLKAGKEPRDSF